MLKTAAHGTTKERQRRDRAIALKLREDLQILDDGSLLSLGVAAHVADPVERIEHGEHRNSAQVIARGELFSGDDIDLEAAAPCALQLRIFDKDWSLK